MVEDKGSTDAATKYKDCNQGSWLAFLCHWPHTNIGQSEWVTKQKQDTNLEGAKLLVLQERVG